MKLVAEFRSLDHRVRTYVYEEEPRQRTLLLKGGKTARVSLPRMGFFVRKTAEGVSLWACTPVGWVETSEARVYRVRPAEPNLWPVCFGSVADEVKTGRLDPIEAFWMTSFDMAPVFAYGPTEVTFEKETYQRISASE